MQRIDYTWMDTILASKVIVAGHRGYKARYPENTLPSFKAAMDGGADMLEMDVNITRDGIPVVIHDLTVDRTTDGSGTIRSLTLEEIRRLDAAALWKGVFDRHVVPTLEEFCLLMDNYPHVLLNVEIKDRTREAVDSTMDILSAHRMVPRCVFTCFDASILAYFHDEYHVRTQGFPGEKMHNFHEGTEGTYSKMFAVGIEMGLLTAQRTAFFRNLGIHPWAYCPDTYEQALLCRHMDVELVTCNELAPALELFGSSPLGQARG